MSYGIWFIIRMLNNLKQGGMSSGDYYTQIQQVWREPNLYRLILIGQEKGIENWRMYELLSGVNLEYNIVRA